MRRLELLVPALFWPDAAATSSGEGLDTPALDALFVRGERRQEPGPGVEHWLAQRFALDSTRELPFAALALAGDGGKPGTRVWMRADPVHLHARGTELYLTRGADLTIEPHEAATMIAALNEFFRDDGLRFEAHRPSEWYLALERMPRLRTTPLGLAHGRSIGPLLPTGEDAASWQKRLSEAQMLLHGLAVNEAREDRGIPPVNSLWPWGAGESPASVPAGYEEVFSRDTVTRGLGLASGARVHEVPADASTLLDTTGAGTVLVRFDDAGDAAARGDAGAWQRALSELSANWVQPVLGAIRSRRLEQFVLTGFAGRTGLTVTASRRELWRFWRRRAPYASWRPAP